MVSQYLTREARLSNGERILSSMDCVRKIGYSHTKEWIWTPILSHCSMSYACLHAKSFQSCPILYNSMDCNPQGSSVHGIFQARILEWVTIPFSGGFSQPKDRTWVFHIAGRFTVWDLGVTLFKAWVLFASLRWNCVLSPEKLVQGA